MYKLVCDAIADIVGQHKELMKIPLRQRAKFEGWLKFELAYDLERKGMKNIIVESRSEYSRNRPDISFFHNETIYTIELKTANTNWKSEGVSASIRPITKNIKSIISDAIKLNSTQGIIAFILFPIPCGDRRWELYLKRIIKNTGINISFDDNCRLIQMNVDALNKCDILVCAFMSKMFNNWRL